MARHQLVFLVAALFFFAIVGLASAAGTEAPTTPAAAADAPAADDVVGSTDAGSEPDAAPVGGPVSSETFPKDQTPTTTDAPAAAGATGGGASAAFSLHSLSIMAIGAFSAFIANAYIY